MTDAPASQSSVGKKTHTELNKSQSAVADIRNCPRDKAKKV